VKRVILEAVALTADQVSKEKREMRVVLDSLVFR